MSDGAQRVRKIVNGTRVVLFMKGTPEWPQCGFSMRATQILTQLGVPFRAVNVLDDWDIRQGVKDFGNWPTIPQLYVDGELVGGSDIMMQMYEQGELAGVVGGST